MKSFFIMARSQAACLIGLTGVMCVCLQLIAISKPVPFDTLREFKDFANAKGFFSYFHSLGDLGWNAYLSDHPLTSDELQALKTSRMRDCDIGPAWRGILFVSEIETKSSYMELDSLPGKWRTFGRLVFAGDEAFMNQVDRLYRNRR
jgi:hypothetical protein